MDKNEQSSKTSPATESRFQLPPCEARSQPYHTFAETFARDAANARASARSLCGPDFVCREAYRCAGGIDDCWNERGEDGAGLKHTPRFVNRSLGR
jgi:hypothetical protein